MIKQTYVKIYFLFDVWSFVLNTTISNCCKLCVCGLGYELMVLGLWLIIARTRGNVGIGMVVVVWLRQGKRKIMMPKKKYKEEEKSKS